MEIYVVQQGDDINSIAERYGFTVEKLIQDNWLVYPYNLVIGQTLVIALPKQTHTVQQGDTVQSIADSYNISIMQLLRNNPNLANRQNIYPGESLVISYYTSRSITTNGFAFPFIRQETLIRTLPNLTYLSIFNYTTTEKSDIITYYDDTEIVKISKEYGVIPLLLLTTLTPQGKPNIEVAYNILLNEEYQDIIINGYIDIMKRQGYLGGNLIFDFLNEHNQTLHQNFVKKIANRFQSEGFLLFLTINYRAQEVDDMISINKINYSNLSTLVNGIIFLKLVWGSDYGPPGPVININNLSAIIDYVASNVSPDKIIIGKPFFGYDWQLPYITNRTHASSLSLNSASDLAYDVGAVIQFDENSLTPYYYYNEFIFGYPAQHIVWFIDARSIDALDKLIIDYSLAGSGVWNIMVYYQQLWTIINANFDKIKLI